uniref:Acetate kinase n=1 Tax=candidate division WOR-3 bacterium TaxID=2052148 RepID=A0A7C4UBD9_UNCW3
MGRLILTLNCGSSSIKYSLFDRDTEKIIAKGIVERVTIGGSFIKHEILGREKIKIEEECPTHKEGINLIIKVLEDPEIGVLKDRKEIIAVGHRVVHGGEVFTKSVVINEEVIEKFKELSDLAPLHNPPNVLGIESAMEILPDIPHIAVMDTAFHQTMPNYAYIYPIPYEWYMKYGVRRYGFHGTSHLYVSRRAACLLGKKPDEVNLITCHIGNGASITAIKNGVSIDTSMGFTPLEGVVMGTRSGDIDPAIIGFISDKLNISAQEVINILNKKSGILGITGKYTDRRDVETGIEEGDERCILAFKIEAYRIRKYIGAYMAVLGHTDAIVFTAGVGEMWPELRYEALKNLEELGIKVDDERNKKAKSRDKEFIISTDDSKIKVFVIPTDEEIVFVEDVIALIEGRYRHYTSFEYSFQKEEYKKGG